YYGLDMVAEEPKILARLQVHVNDTLRSQFRAPMLLANKILWAEIGVIPCDIQARYIRRRAFGRMERRGYGRTFPWFGCVRNKWGSEGGWDGNSLVRRYEGSLQLVNNEPFNDG